ncbi:MAG: dihydropteroate synthase [Rhodobacteraceae bacterium]|nr:MAG: dihydropteroate synthase [Paracoccaceae bacterium]
MSRYFRPIIQSDCAKPENFYYLADQAYWFDKVEIIERGKESLVVSAEEIPTEELKILTNSRSSQHANFPKKPSIMGILNVTPDSFSDGGENFETLTAITAAETMMSEGADIIDIGGESTRPGAKAVAAELELTRIEPVLSALKNKNSNYQISVDTRKSGVIARAIELGVNFINDVSALSFDEHSRDVLANHNVQVCLVHGGLNPEKMQENMIYDDVLLDIYDYLKDRIDFAVAGGIKKENIVVDPGIGFGKTISQNIRLITKASLFHVLGCPILYGVSRKRFIGEIGKAPEARNRFPGSIAVAIELIRQGVHIIRVHDVKETKQALDLWEALVNRCDLKDGSSA